MITYFLKKVKKEKQIYNHIREKGRTVGCSHCAECGGAFAIRCRRRDRPNVAVQVYGRAVERD